MTVFWDTNLFIYLLEPGGGLRAVVMELEGRMSERGDALYASAIALGELLVGAKMRSDEVEAERMRRILVGMARVVPFDEAAAEHYAVIRSRTAIKGPDAFQLACAASVKADLFVTNDDRLSRKIVPGVAIVCSLASVPI